MSVQVEARRAPQGHAGGETGGGDSFAAPPKLRRRPGLVAASLVLVTVGAVAAAWVTTAVGNTVPVVAVRTDVARGEMIMAEDLTVVRIGIDPALSTIAGEDLDAIVGMRAASDLAAGGLVTAGSVTDEAIPAAGESVVGISLSAAQRPARELRPGDRIRVVSTPREGDDPPVQTPATVPATVVTTLLVPETGEVVVDVSVPQAEAGALVAAAATGRVALVLDGAPG